MLTDLMVRTGPENYQMAEGVLDKIPAHLRSLSIKRVLVFKGTKGWEKAKPYLTALLEDKDLDIEYRQFSGECSYEEVQRVTDFIRDNQIEFIIGVGGGKLCDTVKYAASNAHIFGGTIPTLASNCAPWTPLSVMYDEDHRSEGGYELLPQQLNFCFIEPRIIMDSPKEYFIAGIADTLAKWYESDLVLEDEELKSEPMLMMAREAARICRDMIKQHGNRAIADMDRGEISHSFLKMIEVVIAIAGLVGGLGDDYARSTGAHAMHDTLTSLRPEVHNVLHGNKVAYGTFFQLAIEGKWDELSNLIPMYQDLELPQCLADMDIKGLDESELDAIVKRLLIPEERIHTLPMALPESHVKQAIIDLEFYINKHSQTFNFEPSSKFA